MKSFTCDVCKETVTGETEADVMTRMMAHMEEKHKDMATGYHAKSQEDKDKMLEEMKKMVKDVA